jgi:hypothetical protein
MLRTEPNATQREVVRLVLERERELAGLERLLGSGVVAAVRVLAADGVVVRHGERLWASPCLSRLDDLGLVALLDGAGEDNHQHAALRSTYA